MPPRYPRDDSRAITSSSKSNDLNWQIDIPGLAQLLLRFGADGLKRLQLSGVDIHTVGCMLYLGEMTPASVAFRSKLQKVRQTQRAKTWWFHGAVQYGSGVSFVVDELLKLRAGENVLALLTATISIMEGSSIEILNFLFEKLDAGMQNTPSIAQLENIRSVCLNLARDMEFKDRLAEIHHWLITQTSHKGVTYMTYNQAIPSTTTIVNLVEILKDISTQVTDRRSRLAFYGSHGAAWLILYAKDILGLSVCLVFQDSNTVPLSGEFSTADVLLFPQASGATDVFKYVDKASDVISLTSVPDPQTLSTNWLFSCGEGGVDFFALICCWNMKNRQEIGDLIYSMSAEYIERRVSYRDYGGHFCNETYNGQDLTTKFNILRQTLHLLGLPDQFTRKTTWRDDHFSRNWVDGEPRTELKLRQFSSMLQHMDKSADHFCEHTRLQPSEITTAFSICVRCHLYAVVREVAYFSCCLVFSDWYLGLRKISQQRVRTGGDNLAQISYGYFNAVYGDPDFKVSEPELQKNNWSYGTDHVGLVNELAAICSESAYASDLIRSSKHKFLGVNIDGMVMVNYRAIESSLQPGPCVIVRDGQFSLQGEQRPLLVASIYGGSSSFGCEVDIKNQLAPFDHFPGMALSVKASLQRDAIRMQHTVSYESSEDSEDWMSLEIDVPVLVISDGLQSLHLIPSCTHGFETPLQVSEVQVYDNADGVHQPKSYWKDSVGDLWQIRDTLKFETIDFDNQGLPRAFNIFHLYPVKNNALAQWASVALAQNQRKESQIRHGGMYLQQKACLACTGDYVRAQLSKNDHYDICIIMAGK